MVRVILYVLVGLLGTAAHAGGYATDSVKLSDGIDAACKALSQRPDSGRHVVLIDVESVDLDGAARLLASIDDLRLAKGVVIAICPKLKGPATDGAAICALACDAVCLVSETELRGASTKWCTSPSRRLAISEQLARLGRIDPLLSSRTVDDEADLSWTSEQGFQKDRDGDVLIAEAGLPIRLDFARLKQLGIEPFQASSVEEALESIESGAMKPRRLSESAESGSFGGVTGRRKSDGDTEVQRPGGPVKPPAKPEPQPPKVAAPEKPAAPDDVPPSPATDPKLAEKLAEKLTEYSGSLEKVQSLLREFDDFYEGRKGIWVLRPKGLKSVWKAGVEHTDDPDTRVACQRLQRDIKTNMAKLDSCLKSIERIVKAKDHPDLVRLKANKKVLDGLRTAIERNRVSDYDTYSGPVRQLK